MSTRSRAVYACTQAHSRLRAPSSASPDADVGARYTHVHGLNYTLQPLSVAADRREADQTATNTHAHAHAQTHTHTHTHAHTHTHTHAHAHTHTRTHAPTWRYPCATSGSIPLESAIMHSHSDGRERRPRATRGAYRTEHAVSAGTAQGRRAARETGPRHADAAADFLFAAPRRRIGRRAGAGRVALRPVGRRRNETGRLAGPARTVGAALQTCAKASRIGSALTSLANDRSRASTSRMYLRC